MLPIFALLLACVQPRQTDKLPPEKAASLLEQYVSDTHCTTKNIATHDYDNDHFRSTSTTTCFTNLANNDLKLLELGFSETLVTEKPHMGLSRSGTVGAEATLIEPLVKITRSLSYHIQLNINPHFCSYELQQLRQRQVIKGDNWNTDWNFLEGADILIAASQNNSVCPRPAVNTTLNSIRDMIKNLDANTTTESKTN